MLLKRAQDFIDGGANVLSFCSLLLDRIQEKGANGLAAAQLLFESDYSGYTFKQELKLIAASSLLVWGEAGVRALGEGARRSDSFTTYWLCSMLLASVAAGRRLPSFFAPRDAKLKSTIEDSLASQPNLPEHCRAQLVSLVLSIDAEDDVAHYIGTAISNFGMSDALAAREVFAALSARWLAVSTPVLQRYEAMIRNTPDSEPKFQEFLTQHPQLLDPMVVTVWPQPNLFGAKFPDFVLRRIDDSYLIIEIETPAKRLITKDGNISSLAVHAERQVTDYQSYLGQRPIEVRASFPNFQEADCLVVCGLENKLSPKQKNALRDVNRTRHRVRLVGFDWLAERARSIAQNVTKHAAQISTVRLS
ncbi:MAG: Shedu anti-phage system protein SduA domain-containing protein [Hyphomicrobiaceae bacterium]